MQKHGLKLLFLLPFMAACSATGPQVRTETVEVRVPVFVALPEAMTAPPAEPAAPLPACVDRGQPTLCNEQMVSWLEDLRAWGRGMAGQLREIRERQPERAP